MTARVDALFTFKQTNIHKSWSQEHLASGLVTGNHPTQLHTLARILKFWIQQVLAIIFHEREEQRCRPACTDVQSGLHLCCSQTTRDKSGSEYCWRKSLIQAELARICEFSLKSFSKIFRKINIFVWDNSHSLENFNVIFGQKMCKFLQISQENKPSATKASLLTWWLTF